MSLISKLALAAALGFASLSPVFAETIEIKMYTKNPDNKKERNVFIPAFVTVKPGDTIKWIASDKGHNTASGKGMLPEGAEKWKSKFSKDFEITLQKPGVYGYVCSPHEGLGMVGMIVVEGEGMLSNLQQVKDAKKKGKGKKRFAKLIEQAEELGK